MDGGCYYSKNTYINGGYAGTLTGGNGNIYNAGSSSLVCATGATQISGGYGAGDNRTGTFAGLFGKGGYGTPYSQSWNYFSGGGGGFYGGGCGNAGPSIIGSASGGSSYISGYEGCNSISSTSTENNIVHTGSIVHYSGKYFLYTRMESGRDYMPSTSNTLTEVIGNSGNGYCKITKMKVE